MQTASSSSTSVSIPSDAPRSVDDALNSSTWFQQQRYWEEVRALAGLVVVVD
jgi:hypothetical protein